MTEPLILTHDPRLAPFATTAAAAWLWAADGSRVLWANASGAMLFGTASPLALLDRSFIGHDLGMQVARIAATLSPDGPSRAETLTGANHAEALACTCSRITAGAEDAVLVVADAPVQPVLPLAERAMRMFGASAQPLLVFSGMGALLLATPAAADKAGAAPTLAALGAGALGHAAVFPSLAGMAASTASAWPATLTPRHSAASRPRGSIRKVERTTPRWRLP